MPSSPELIFIFLGRGLKKSEYSSNSKLHDFKLDTLWEGDGAGEFYFILLLLFLGGKISAFGAIFFKENYQIFQLIFSPKFIKKLPCFYT
jgi:hypothetical protein